MIWGLNGIWYDREDTMSGGLLCLCQKLNPDPSPNSTFTQ